MRLDWSLSKFFSGSFSPPIKEDHSRQDQLGACFLWFHEIKTNNNIVKLKPFLSNASILYSMEIAEKRWFSDFRKIKNRSTEQKRATNESFNQSYWLESIVIWNICLLSQKRKPIKRKQKEHPICETADEAIKTMLAEKKLSSKINYDVLRGLKDEENKEMENDFNVVKNESSILDEESLKSEGDIMKGEDDKDFLKAENEIKLQMETVYESGPVDKAKKKR